MNNKLYALGLILCFIYSCKQGQIQEPTVDSVTVISKATEFAGGIANWQALQEVKFGVNRVLINEDKQLDKNEIHIYEFGERPKKRISYEAEDGSFITQAEILGQYFSFNNEIEDTLANRAIIKSAMKTAFQMSCLPFGISELEGQMKYMGLDSITNEENADVVAISGEQEKWWFYFSQKSGEVLSFTHLENGVRIHNVVKASQTFEGFKLPVYVKRYKVYEGKKELIEDVYFGNRTFK